MQIEKENYQLSNIPQSKYMQINSTKDSINSISTKCCSTNSSLSSSTKISINNNIFNFNFGNKEEYIKYNGDYLNDLYSNLLDEEKAMTTKPKYGYMVAQTDINEKMRAILIDWIIEIHDKFHLHTSTLFQTVWLIDTYLTLKFIKRSQFQLLGLGCLYISSKFQEILYPQIKDCIEATDGAYTKEELLNMEKDILKTINYSILPPSQIDFFNIISKSFKFDEKQYYLGRYLMENTLIDYNMIKYPSSVIAVSCAYIAMKICKLNNYKKLYSEHIIREKCPQKIIKETATELCFLVKNLNLSEFKAVKEKYSSEKYHKVADYFKGDL